MTVAAEGGLVLKMKDIQINHTADENFGHFVTRLFCHEKVFVILHDAFVERFVPPYSNIYCCTWPCM